MDEELKIKGDLDIQKALQEFEVQSRKEETLKQVLPIQISGSSKITHLVIKWSGGTIQNEAQSNVVLLFLVVACLVAAFTIIFFGFFRKDVTTYISSEEVIYRMQNYNP